MVGIAMRNVTRLKPATLFFTSNLEGESQRPFCSRDETHWALIYLMPCTTLDAERRPRKPLTDLFVFSKFGFTLLTRLYLLGHRWSGRNCSVYCLSTSIQTNITMADPQSVAAVLDEISASMASTRELFQSLRKK